ncbi:Proteinase inhibitor I3, Kunitz legume [Corchorus capsularis]|uniref:Proteinase inhibitor I3, Kunitz legume n=1 Tax=Corchorus capsularis TaxID=210143 RepID=A0A1R3HW16_COCAP|nr:Proteinase inhibitor I3, Kunitz legume [Corchorus capsularis]
MKTKIAILLFLVLVFSSKSSYAQVLDTNGNPVQVGTKYYVVSANWGAGGGLSLSPGSRSQSCPYTVIQERSPQNYGYPVTFSSLDPNVTTIGVSAPLNMVFVLDEDSNQCPDQSLAWKVTKNPSTGQWDVTTGGAAGNPDASASQFQIERFSRRSSGYGFSFCPPGCSCKQLGVSVPRFGEEPRLGLTSNGAGGASFSFQKVDNIRIKQVA